MKKISVVFALALVVLACTLVGCSSDDKKSSSTNTGGKKSSGESKDSQGSSKVKTDPAAERAFKEDLEGMKSAVATGCANINASYSRYKTTGNASDGFDEILEIKGSFTDISIAMQDASDPTTWPDYLDDDSYYNTNVDPFHDKLEEYFYALDSVTESAIYDKQTTEELEIIHTTMADFEEYVNNSEFGPCVID